MKKLMAVIVMAIVLLTTACAPATPPPVPGQPTAQTQAVEQTGATPPPAQPAATPSPTPEPLPPLVVQTVPEPGEELPIDAAIEITFDQPMDRDSVEKAFAIEPGASADGVFEWPNDRTVRFTFKNGFERGQRYRVRLVETAKSQAGLALPRPFELRFSIAGFLEVTAVQPADGATDVLPDSSVTVVFNRPVVPLTAIENQAGLPNPLTFVPPVTGKGEWLNTSIYRFTPDDGFAPAVQYTARVSAGLTDALEQASLPDDFEWTFTTVQPRAIASIPADGDFYVSPTPVISVTFNQPMDRDSVEENFELRNVATGDVIPGRFEWASTGLSQPGNNTFTGYYDYKYAEGEGPEEIGVETVMFTPAEPLDFETGYVISLPRGTRGQAPGSATPDDFIATFTVTPYPAVLKTNPADGDKAIDPWQNLEITFSAPMNPESLKVGQNLIIEPAIAITEVYTYWWSSNTRLQINFPTRASTRYKVSLGPDIEGRYGHKLNKTTTIAWETRASNPLLFMHTPGRIAAYNAYTDTLAFVTVRNLNRVNFALYRLSTAEFLRLNRADWWETWRDYRPSDDQLLADWSIETSPELNQNAIYRVDLGQKSGLGDRLPPGLYYFEAAVSSNDLFPEARLGNTPPPERKILVVSKRNLTLKTSGNEGLAWLTDLQTGQPVVDTTVSFFTLPYDNPPTLLDSVSTGRDGVAQLTYPDPIDPGLPAVVFAGDPDAPDDDFAVAFSNWADGIERYWFNNVSVEDYQQSYVAHFYTDRNIYRPGQTVYFKGVIRQDDDAHYSLPPAGRKVEVTVYDSQGKEIFKDDLPLSNFGTVNGSVALAENATLGSYFLEAVYKIDNDQRVTFSDDFLVAAYRKPEFLVNVTTDRPEYVQGDTINVTVFAEFFSGGPVSDAKVRWTLLSDDYIFRHPVKDFYDFTDYDLSRQAVGEFYPGFGEAIAEGEGQTGPDGRFTFSAPADIADRIASQRFTFDVVVTDINDQEVASQAEAIVHKGLVYVGLQPERYVGQAGEENRVNVLAVDWDAQPVARQKVQVVFAEHNWYSVQRQSENGSFYWDSVVETVPVFTTTVTTNSDGETVAAFTPEKGGVYRIMATAVDRDGNEVRASTFMWVSGRKYVNWRQENNDRLELVADKRQYRVGETATILVPHPYSGTVQALVTLERGHIYRHFVTELKTNSDQLEIPVEEWMIPNMYVSVVVVKGMSKTDPIPGFKVGYASLPIDTSGKSLTITLTPDKPANAQYQPREMVAYHIKVTDAQGQPVQAELSLALVDKAVLSLSPEAPGQLLATFWRNRGLGVQTGMGLTLNMDRVNLAVAPEAKGGGGGFDQGFGEIRGEFKDTALWMADFVTDENGEGVVQADLPDNLTTWTLTGKGITAADTLVGEGTVEIVSTKPLLVRPVAPRFFVVGDQAQIGMVVQNNSDRGQQVTARLQAEGLEVSGWRVGKGEWQSDGEPQIAIPAGERVRIEYQVTVQNVGEVSLTMGAKSAGYGDALTFDLPVYTYSTPETVATLGVLPEDGLRLEGVLLPRHFDPTQGDLTVSIEPSLAAGMRDGLRYLEHFPYECTEQTVSRFLPNVFTYRAYQQLGIDRLKTDQAAALKERLPGLVSVGLQRLYSQQHVDGGWGWWVADDSNPFLTAYVLLGLVEAKRAGFAVDDEVIQNAAGYLQSNLKPPRDVEKAWQANRQAFILYALAEAGTGDLGRSVALFKEREKLDYFGRAFLAMAIHRLDEEASQVDTLVADLTDAAIISATGAHWEEAQVDYFAMNTDTRSTAVIIAALSRIQPDHPLLPQAVRWLMTVREEGGHWETTQETAWAIIGLTDWMVATGELEGRYTWRVSLNGEELGAGEVDETNIDETTRLRVEVGDLLADQVNRLAVERDPVGGEVSGSPGQLYYTAYLTYYKPVQEVKALNRGIIVSRQYRLVDDESGRAVSEAEVGDVIQVRLTLIAPHDLHYVVVEDPFPAGAEPIDASLATTSVVGQQPELLRIDRRNPWGRGYGWWYFSHAELRDEKAVLFATYLPKGTYEYTYTIRASLPGEYRVIPTHAEEMYFPEVFGRSDGGVFKIR